MNYQQESCDSNVVTKPIPIQGKCYFYIDRKKRFCRFTQMKNADYCAEHATVMGVNLERKRISCPLNPKHSCYEDQLQKHLKKCQRAQGELPPYHNVGINSGDSGGENVPDPKVTILTVSTEELQELVAKVNRLFEEHIGDIPTEILSHESLNEEINNPSLGLPALRHRKQQASLIGHMEKAHLLRDDICYVEMGAGKGQLSHWLYSAVSGHQNICFVLVDRSTVRYKYDNLHKAATTSDGGSAMERIRIDIENLNLGNLLSLKQIEKAVVAFGKHLCGSATDLALRCIMETLPTCIDGKESHNKLAKPSSPRNPGGVVIALCCHHRCTWQAYVGKAFFRSCGLSARDFQLISSMSSWATCCWKGWRSDSSQGQRSSGGEVKVTPKSDICVKKCLDNQESKEMINCENNKCNQKMTKRDTESLGLSENSDKSDTQAQTTKESYDTDDDVDEKEHYGDPKEIQEMKRYVFKLSEKEREEVGRKCKHLIDYGRVMYLKDKGLNSQLKIFIENYYTPENVILIATSGSDAQQCPS
ncbi:hypothetical protein CHS0354_042200 [Potamilus streckersoni]|uniref:tRNA:m(4)X modification enzyme TRM13 n=1 Tax=Potamilus streckersoni TaxID=2493646 RepID=A0AAE0WGJ2_9BIVA|nr:hypothetical protein CHS0354_042200 [Potamilus streckersoni]